MTGTTLHIPTLETERLVLRAPRAQDFEPFAAFCASPRAVGVGGPYARSDAFTRLCAIVGQWQLLGYGRWIVADKGTDEALGFVGIFHPEGWPGPEIGWSVFEAAEGRGIAFEAAVATRAYAYETLGWDTIISCTKPDNTRSIALANRMGCTADGGFEHEIHGPHLIWRHPSAQELAA